MKLHKERKDVFQGGSAPAEYRRALIEVGGLNPYREANFRLSLSERTNIYQGGEWHHWADGTSLRDRGGMYVNEDGQKVTPSDLKPLRITAEMRWIRRYPDLKGWILQEWFPATHYGPKEDWDSYTVKGYKLSRLGPYPEQGDYELALPYGWKQAASVEIAQRDHRFQGHTGLPPIHVLRTAIQYAEYCREFWMSMKPGARIRCRENQMLEQEALREKWTRDRDMAIHRDALGWLFNTSLEAGRMRQAIADKAGLKIGHVGA